MKKEQLIYAVKFILIFTAIALALRGALELINCFKNADADSSITELTDEDIRSSNEYE